jgi:hypothetical protein
MKPVSVLAALFMVITLLLSTGCGTTGTQSMISAGGAATGAYIGHSASNKNPYWTAGGAAGGVIVGSLMNYKLQQQIQKAEQHGFDRAMNQSVRQHYWMLQNMQKNLEASNEVNSYSYVPIVRPEITIDGVNFNESREYIISYE